MKRKNRSDQRKFHFIYRTTCTVTGKYYIGMHSTDDMDDGYLGSGKRLRNSVRKHGKNHHERAILEDCSEKGRAFLRRRERVWVGKKQLRDPLCMNLVVGGRGYDGTLTSPNKGKKLSADQRKKMSIALKGRKVWNKGLSKTTDPRVLKNAQMLSNIKKGRNASTHEYIAKHAALLSGRTKENNESVAKMAQKRKGVPWSEARRRAHEKRKEKK